MKICTELNKDQVQLIQELIKKDAGQGIDWYTNIRNPIRAKFEEIMGKALAQARKEAGLS